MVSEDDTAYKQLFAHPEMVRDLLQGFVCADWVQRLDCGTFERVNGSYISDSGDHRHGDMVWRVRLAGEWIYIYLLLEFQSRSDPWMALRMQVYIGLLYQDLIKRGELPEPGRLPPVFPVVLYIGKRRWRACMNLAELIVPVAADLQALQASQRYLLLDVHRMKSGALRNNLVAFVFDMERAQSAQDLTLAAQNLSRLANTQKDAELSQNIGPWSAFRLRGLSNRLNIELSMPLKEDAMHRSEIKTFADGFNYGLMLWGIKDQLERLLIKRYGKLPKRYVVKINYAEQEQLDLWFERMWDAKSLKEIFAEPLPA